MWPRRTSSRERKPNSNAENKKAPIGYTVFTALPVPIVTTDPCGVPPEQKQNVWSPTTSTLIYGKRDAVLVDPLLTVAEGRALADRVEDSGKNLTTIYVTHGHGDHFFGAAPVLERFPDARMLAIPAAIAVMHQQLSPKYMSDWRSKFPSGQLIARPPIADPLSSPRFELEGHDMIAVPTGRTDTYGTSVLYVPDIGLVVAGDVVYNGVHVHLADSTSKRSRREWLAALDKVEQLHPRAVIAGHKRPGNTDSPRTIEETRQYIRDFDYLVETTRTAQQLYREMLSRHPDRLNPRVLWDSARAVKGKHACPSY